MILTGHQPAYLPWLGYFEKIMNSDSYVYVDTVQFEHRSFINRNKIKTSQGELWLTIPVLAKGHRETTLMELQINNDIKWQRKHLNSISTNYKKAPRYDEIYEKIQPFYTKRYDCFVEFCYEFTMFWFHELKINTPVFRLSQLNIQGKKSELVLNMCKFFSADTYISGALGKDYMDNELFEKNGINIIYQNYKPQEYPQLWSKTFLPCLSVLDFVMNTDDYSLIRGKGGIG